MATISMCGGAATLQCMIIGLTSIPSQGGGGGGEILLGKQCLRKRGISLFFFFR